VGDERDDAVADRRDRVGRRGVAARRLRAADAGDRRGGERDHGDDEDERDPVHVLDTPPRGLMSHMRYVFVDCRWALDDPESGRREYIAGHIPGAVFLDVERDLSSPPGPDGRHPLPTDEQFTAAASRAGIDAGTFVVPYGSLGGAERLWWLLRHYGHDACAVLDLAGWHGPLQTCEELAEPRPFEPRPRTGDTIELPALASPLGATVVLHTRLPLRWRL